MERPSRRCRCGSSRGARRSLPALALLPTLVLLAGCATTPPAPTATPEAIPSHVYARPLDDVLMETTTLLVNNGWKVQRSGNTLVTEWRSGGEASAITYRVYGQRVDAAYCSVRIERVLATRTVVWTEPRLSGHSPGPGAPNPVAASREMYNPYDVPPAEFEEDTPNEKRGERRSPTAWSSATLDETRRWSWHSSSGWSRLPTLKPGPPKGQSLRRHRPTWDPPRRRVSRERWRLLHLRPCPPTRSPRRGPRHPRRVPHAR